MKRVFGLVVAGGNGLLADLGVPQDAALTPFAGKYRFIDFALATLVNAGAAVVHVAASRPGAVLRAHLRSASRAVRVLQPQFPVGGRRAERALGALLACARRAEAADTIVILGADHLLRLDVGRLIDTHRRRGADLTLCAMPLSSAEVQGRAGLDVAGDARVLGAGTPRALPACGGLVQVWTGDLVVRAGSLPALAALLGGNPAGEDADLLDLLAGGLDVRAHDVVEADRRSFFWHDPGALEAYYEMQMNLCTLRPTLDLYDPRWPVRPAGRALAPAKVVADAVGRPGQALNSLVSDGAVVRGGVVINTVLGHGVIVESGAEVEDSVLLDGCRVGRDARVRRAVVGVGAVIGDAGEIGYGRSPAPPARVLPSALTLVPPAVENQLVAVGA